MTELGAIVLMLRWALLVLGVIYFVTESAIFMHPRIWIAQRGKWALLGVYCPACVGFWVGGALAFWTWPFDLVVGHWQWLHVLEGGVASMALGALWKILNGGNPAYAVEAEMVHDNETTQEEEQTNAQG